VTTINLDRIPQQFPSSVRLIKQGLDGAAYRVQNGRFAGLKVIVSVAIEGDGKAWLHVSCSRRDRLPSWEDLKFVKETFIGESNYAYQIFPPKSQYVNIHPYCLHLYHCLEEAPLPEFSFLGLTI
jgi:hypothetical protein